MSARKGATNSRNATPRILAVLPATCAQIKERTGLADPIPRLRAMRDAGLAHIGGWDRLPDGVHGCHWIAVYHAGPGPDVPCRFKRKTRKQINEAFVRRKRESGELDAILAKKRMRYWEKKAATRGDPLVAALFGKIKR